MMIHQNDINDLVITAFVPYVHMIVWFTIFYALGLFSGPLATLFAILVLCSYPIDEGIVKFYRFIRGNV